MLAITWRFPRRWCERWAWARWGWWWTWWSCWRRTSRWGWGQCAEPEEGGAPEEEAEQDAQHCLQHQRWAVVLSPLSPWVIHKNAASRQLTSLALCYSSPGPSFGWFIISCFIFQAPTFGWCQRLLWLQLRLPSRKETFARCENDALWPTWKWKCSMCPWTWKNCRTGVNRRPVGVENMDFDLKSQGEGQEGARLGQNGWLRRKPQFKLIFNLLCIN